MTSYLVVEAFDETGAKLGVQAARLLDDQAKLAVALVDDAVRGMSADITAVAPGAYQVAIDLPDRPTFAFNGAIEAKKGRTTFVFAAPSPRCCGLTTHHASRGDATSPSLVTLTLRVGRTHEEIVLVAGWDYSGGSDNTLYAKTWRDDLYDGKTTAIRSPSELKKGVAISPKIRDYTRVTLFDFKTGDRTRWFKGQSRWHQVDRVLQGAVRTHLGKYSDPANEQKRHDDDAISITHVYDYIIELGRRYAGSLIGFHIFSHAWDGGPLLVNTNQAPIFHYGGARDAERDPGDKDGRHKDFDIINMPEVALFKAAFRGDAALKIWGCLAVDLYRDMIRAAARARKTKRPRDEPLNFSADGQAVTMSQAQIEDEFRARVLPDAYMSRLAAAVGLTVFGAPPGVGSNLARVGKKDYMYVNQAVHATILQWCEDALGLKRDLSGHIAYD
jgi:hypothetical protein